MSRSAVGLVAVLLAACTAPAGKEPSRPEASPQLREDERALAAAFVAFARDPSEESWAAVPARRNVRLGLGRRILVARPREELAGSGAWELRPRGLFRGGVGAFGGAFSALAPVARTTPKNVLVAQGPQPRCAGPPLAPPPRLPSALERLTLRPRRVESCLMWWAVDLYVDRHGQLAAVTLDLWEP